LARVATIRLTIGNNELRAIGHVVAQWAYLEVEIDILLSQLLSQPRAATLATRRPQSFERRMDLLRLCATTIFRGAPAVRNELLAISNAAASLRGDRDDIAHGRWHMRVRHKKPSPIVTVFRHLPAFKVRERPLAIEQMEKIAGRISNITVRLIIWRETVFG
jgi:hypothetical protein